MPKIKIYLNGNKIITNYYLQLKTSIFDKIQDKLCNSIYNVHICNKNYALINKVLYILNNENEYKLYYKYNNNIIQYNNNKLLNNLVHAEKYNIFINEIPNYKFYIINYNIMYNTENKNNIYNSKVICDILDIKNYIYDNFPNDVVDIEQMKINDIIIKNNNDINYKLINKIDLQLKCMKSIKIVSPSFFNKLLNRLKNF